MRLTNCSAPIYPLFCYKIEDNTYIGSATTTADRKLYYIKNRQKKIEYSRQYRRTHKQTNKTKQRDWYYRNKERLRIKYGYKTRYKTKTNYKPFSIVKTPIQLCFD
jgi:hypothetical protein